ncbi:AAR2 protein, partial [Aphelenchoides avenae]
MTDPARLAAATSNGEMPQELARYLFDNGGVMILKDFPTGMEFGIDYKSWQTDHKFLGMKMIPPGVHFIYVSVKDAPRIGFWHCFKEGEIIVRKWDKAAEDFADYLSNNAEIERIRTNLKNLNTNLGPYPYENYRSWTALSTYIKEETIRRLRFAFVSC